MSTTAEKLATIRTYYDACSAGDVEGILAILDPQVTHFFLAPNPGSRPVQGAQHLARYWRKVQALFDGRWTIDSILGEGDEAVIEWTLFWIPPATGARVATRGAEWYRFAADGRILEIRAYFQQLETSSELEDFPYAARGFSRLGDEGSELHPVTRSRRSAG